MIDQEVTVQDVLDSEVLLTLQKKAFELFIKDSDDPKGAASDAADWVLNKLEDDHFELSEDEHREVWEHIYNGLT